LTFPKFFTVCVQFCPFLEKSIFKMLGFKLLESLKEGGQFCPFSFFYIKLFLMAKV